MALKRSWFAGCVLLLAACAAQPKREDVFLEAFMAQLAGSYDNMAQSRANPDHAALRLVIAPVAAGLIGDHVFYVQEMAADDPRRVIAQRLYVASAVDSGDAVVIRQADFTEPLRWRDGHLNRDLFHSLLMQDLRLRAGCDLIWKRDAKGPGYSARTGGSCRASARGTGEALRVDQRFTLDADGIAVFEQLRDAAGVLVQGGEPDPWYRYARRGDAPW
jgi:hypothetical protein